jgi:hypothetical protein
VGDISIMGETMNFGRLKLLWEKQGIMRGIRYSRRNKGFWKLSGIVGETRDCGRYKALREL